MKLILLAALVPALLYFVATNAVATHGESVTMTPLGDNLGLKQTTLLLHAPADNEHIWGTVSGTAKNYATDYPVIIQIYNINGDAVHFAQVDMDESGSFEYLFRVRYVEDGIGVNIFEGDYHVIVSSVVRLDAQRHDITA